MSQTGRCRERLNRMPVGNVNVDMIIQIISERTPSRKSNTTTPKSELCVLNRYRTGGGLRRRRCRRREWLVKVEPIAKVLYALISVLDEEHPGVQPGCSRRFFRGRLNIHMISTRTIRITCVFTPSRWLMAPSVPCNASFRSAKATMQAPAWLYVSGYAVIEGSHNSR
jgi:hypothetical protein